MTEPFTFHKHNVINWLNPITNKRELRVDPFCDVCGYEQRSHGWKQGCIST